MTKPIANVKGVDHYSTTAAAELVGVTKKVFEKYAATLGLEPDGWIRWGGPPIIDIWAWPTVDTIGRHHIRVTAPPGMEYMADERTPPHVQRRLTAGN